MREAEELLEKIEDGINQIDAHEEDANCNQKRFYMANVLLVVHADEQVDSAESELRNRRSLRNRCFRKRPSPCEGTC